ncbi:MAG: TonB-dependent receptor plug domain-containing protein [Chitinophagales bacterium]|nr:TonB-dependent receptor plug domain-containing protein [Chitinophagales bacterium]
MFKRNAAHDCIAIMFLFKSYPRIISATALLWGASSIPLFSFAQNRERDTTLNIQEVIINDSRLENFSAGTKIQSFDEAALEEYEHDNLTDILIDETGLFIKTYGLGSLATSSFRGGSAYQTATLWNGFNINSPMNGLLDFSLVPAGITNSVKIQHGGTSALWGSGAIGGTIHLNNIPVFDKGTTVSASFNAGSFKTFNEKIFFEISKKKWISGLKFSHNSAKNDFPFHNYFLPENPEVKQPNNELKQFSVISDNFFILNKKQKLNLFFWYQYTDRNIPPTMLQATNQSNQKDESYRVTSEWQFSEKKKHIFIRAAYFDENITYSDVAYDYSAYSHSQSVITEAETKFTYGNTHFLNIGINNTFIQASVSSVGADEGYPEQKQRNQIALFTSYKFTTVNKKYALCVSARQELLENRFMPFTFSVGSDLNVLKWLWLKASIARVYRVPTFNDLYWIPGANPDLLAENGFNEDVGLRIFTQTKNEKFSFTFEPTFFNRNINNWIIWLPSQGYWTPQNIMKVWSRGLETSTGFSYEIKKIKFTLSVLANYVLSTNEKSKTSNDASVGKQLIYVPKVKLLGKFSIEYKGFALTYRHSYTGDRYITTDNSASVATYDLANILFSKKFQIKSWELSAFAEIENLFNEQYQVIQSRAMPLRSYSGGITIQFSKPFSNNKNP